MTSRQAFALLGLIATVLIGGLILFQTHPIGPAIQPSVGQPTLPQEFLMVSNTRLLVEIADDDRERRHGLSDRLALAPGTGMLFRFPHPDRPAFWMKDMRFPLDILYLQDGVIREIFADVPFPDPGETPATVMPTDLADAVLEVPAGESARQGWRVGDRAFRP